MSTENKGNNPGKMRRKDLPPQAESVIRPVSPIQMKKLVGEIEPEAEGMNIAESMVYPFIIERVGEPKDKLSVIAPVNFPLQGMSLLQFNNRFAPVKRVLNFRTHLQWSFDVGDDWGFMISALTSGQGYRHHLEGVHENIVEYDEFLKRAPLFLDALDDISVNMKYNIPYSPKAILPTMYFDIDKNGVEWHDQMLTKQQSQVLMRGLTNQMMAVERKGLQPGVTPETFTGMAIPSYIDPQTTFSFPPRIGGQDMSLAQILVLNAEYTKFNYLHDKSRVVANLALYADQYR